MAKRCKHTVKVHQRAGCSLCKRTDSHAHTWADWDRHVHGGNGECSCMALARNPATPSRR